MSSIFSRIAGLVGPAQLRSFVELSRFKQALVEQDMGRVFAVLDRAEAEAIAMIRKACEQAITEVRMGAARQLEALQERHGLSACSMRN